MRMRVRRALIAHRCLPDPVAWLAVVAVLTVVLSAPWLPGAGVTTRGGLVAAALPTPAHAGGSSQSDGSWARRLVDTPAADEAKKAAEQWEGPPPI